MISKVIYECGNCDYTTESENKAKRHRNMHLNSPLADQLPREKINFWIVNEVKPGFYTKQGMIFK